MEENAKRKLLKEIIKKIYVKFSPVILDMNDKRNIHLRKRLSLSYRIRQFVFQEGSDERPSNDHDISVFYRWGKNGHLSWAFQPMFCRSAMLLFGKKVIIELGCGNGWYYREIYYWMKDVTYYGYDLNEYNIEDAKKMLARKEKECGRKSDATFEVKNILTDEEIFNVDATHVFFFATLNMFTQDDRKKILNNIHKALKFNNGIFCGNGGVVLDGVQQWDKFIGLSRNEEEFINELQAFFKNVYVFPREKNDETIYFMASDGELPFYNKQILQ